MKHSKQTHFYLHMFFNSLQYNFILQYLDNIDMLISLLLPVVTKKLFATFSNQS